MPQQGQQQGRAHGLGREIAHPGLFSQETALLYLVTPKVVQERVGRTGSC